jgi:3-deoxy-D-manno-octulosonic acid kinase
MLTPNGQGLGLCGKHFNAQFLKQEKLVTRTAQGRGTVYFFSLGKKALVLRHYKRGGLVAKVSNDRFIFSNIANTRCYKELEVLQHLHNEKVNVPLPIAGKVTRKGMFYSADIITEVIPNTIELHEVLQSEALSPGTWKAIGIQIKKMHNSQVCHADINVKNILVDRQASSPTIYLLDFDKCKIQKGNEWKKANLARFHRSLLKQTGKFTHYHYHQNDWDELHMAYQNC